MEQSVLPPFDMRLDQFVEWYRSVDLENNPLVNALFNDIRKWLKFGLLNKTFSHFTIYEFRLCGSFAEMTRLETGDEIEFDILAVSSAPSLRLYPSSCPGYMTVYDDVLGYPLEPQGIMTDFIKRIKQALPSCFMVRQDVNTQQLQLIYTRGVSVVIDIHPVLATNPDICVIPISCKQPGHTCWRVSYCQYEMNMLRNASLHHRSVFRSMKQLRVMGNARGLEMYGKYELKMAVLWHIQMSNDNYICFHNDTLPCILHILDLLYLAYSQNFIPHIVSGINILKTCGQSQVITNINNLYNILLNSGGSINFIQQSIQSLVTRWNMSLAPVPVAMQPNMQSPVCMQLTMQSPVAMQPNMQSPVWMQPNMQSPVVMQPNMQFPVGMQPIMQSPVAMQPNMQSPVCMQPNMQSPVCMQPNMQSPVGMQPIMVPVPIQQLPIAAPVPFPAHPPYYQ